MSPYSNPDLMVIGDSLAQGTKTLSVTPESVGRCYASILAESQKWQFESVKLPQPVLFDLEDEIDRLKNLTILGAFKRIRSNASKWETLLLGNRAGQPDYFDNLAIAGHTIDETENATAETALEGIGKIFKKVQSGSLADLHGAAATLHMKINRAFVYNPSNKAKYRSFTAMDWVRARQPKNLIVHFGHNDGLYDFGSIGKSVDLTKTTQPGYLKYLKQLDDLPKSIKRIYIVLLPKLSAVANLTPISDERSEGYFIDYQTEFPFPGIRVSGKLARKMDDSVKTINRSARELVAGTFKNSDRVTFIDTYRIFDSIDYKNSLDPGRQFRIGANLPVDNRYLTGVAKGGLGRPGNRSPKTFKYDHGGFQSLDGMHPSGFGYAVFALYFMKETGLLYDKNKFLAPALEAERLIKRYSSGFHSLRGLLSLLPKPESEDMRDQSRNLIEIAEKAFSRFGHK